MKQLVTLSCAISLAFASLSPSLAWSQEPHIETTYTIEPVLYQLEASSELRLKMFQEKKDPLRASLLNIPPFGGGSYLQGDYFTGPILSSIDGLSILSLLYGYFGNHGDVFLGGAVYIILGIMGLGTGRVLGFIAPWVHYRFASDEYMRNPDAAFSYSTQSDLVWKHQIAF